MADEGHRPVIAVIGAGLAGLAAADVLRRDGRCRPVLLEASDEIGGRVRQRGEEGVEMGAEFLHGSTAAARQLVDALGLPTRTVFTTAHGDGGPDEEPAPDGGVGWYWVGSECVRPRPHSTARHPAAHDRARATRVAAGCCRGTATTRPSVRSTPLLTGCDPAVPSRSRARHAHWLPS
jgi:monoamine oxidase